MAEKILNTRILLKYDSYENWMKSDLVLKAGELAIAHITTGDTQEVNSVLAPQILLKVGDGTSKYSALPFVSARAADVYGWAKAANKPTYTADEIEGLENFIAGEIQDTDTQYQIVPVEGETYKFKLQSKGLNDEEWADVTGSVIDLTGANTRLETIEGKLDADKTVAEQISAEITANNERLANEGATAGTGEVIGSVSQSNGVITVATKTLTADDIPELPQSKITGLEDALAGMQAELVFDGTYDAENNKAATVASITDRIGLLDADRVGSEEAGMVVRYVEQSDGVIAAKAAKLVEADIPELSIAKTTGLQDALDAKQETLAFAGEYNKETNKVVTEDYLDDQLLDLNGAMHFAGTVIGATFEEAIAASGKTYESGDVVLYGVDVENVFEEYVYDGADWYLLGNETRYALVDEVDEKLAALTKKHDEEVKALQDGKQDNLVFNTEYNAETNKVATMSDVSGAITANNANLSYEGGDAGEHKFATLATQSNGVIAVTYAQPEIADVNGLTEAIAGKQDTVDWDDDAEYSADNKAATIASITNRIALLNNDDEVVEGEVVTAVKQSNGVVSVERAKLAAMAYSGNVNDLEQTAGDVLVFNCGTSTEVV